MRNIPESQITRIVTDYEILHETYRELFCQRKPWTERNQISLWSCYFQGEVELGLDADFFFITRIMLIM